MTDAPTIETIQSGAGAVWSRVVSSSWTTSYTSESRDELKPGQSVRREEKYRILRQGPNYLWVREIVSEEGSEASKLHSIVQLTNTKYEAELRRNPGSDGWLLKNWKLAGQTKPGFTPIVSDPAHSAVFGHLTRGEQPLHKFLTAPGTKVTTVGPSPNGGSLVRVAYTSQDEPKPGITRKYAGWVDLDPALGWCIRESEATATMIIAGEAKTYLSRNRYECDADPSGIPVLRRQTFEGGEVRSNGERMLNRSAVMTFSTRYNSDIPEHEFTLSAFGIPEPAGVTWERPTPVYVWLILAATVSAVAAIAFQYARRRVQTPTSS